ncbi:MAG: HDOD domain-containing protein [Candidatus Delongbacteria bacterium]|nr:HDOD domain-containing protein [Candidatus Delongbacteria bacterium]
MSTGNEAIEVMRDRIQGIRDLPTLPTVAVEIIGLVQRESSSVMDVAQVMYRDPVLTAKVLKLANSAFYGLRRQVETLNQAMVVLGFSEILNLVQSVAVIQAFNDEQFEPSFDLAAFWDHSVGTGEISRALAGEIGLRFDGTDFTAGLIHDIGKIILELYFHQDFERVLKASRTGKTPLYQSERKLWSVDHTEIGSWLAEKWMLPVRLVDVIRHHHNPLNSSTDPALVAVIHLANTFAKTAEIGFSGDRVIFDLKRDPAWAVLKEHAPAIEEFDLERFTFQLEERVDQGRDFLRIVNS